MVNALKAQTFHHSYANPILTKLRSKKVLSGRTDLKDVGNGRFECSFLLFGGLQVILRYEISNDVDSLIVEGIYRTDQDQEFIYSFHEHSKMASRPDWPCLNVYELGPHFHFGKEPRYKITCEARISLEQFILFIISRHQYKSLQSLCGPTGKDAKKVGLKILSVP